jgi:CheY-like chemotaxis protein
MYNIINIDDSKLNRKLITRVLEKVCDETNIVECANGLEAVEAYKELTESKYKVDMVLCDYEMPVMDGLETSERFRKMGYDGPFIIITANETIHSKDVPLATYVMHKPINKNIIRELLYGNICPICDNNDCKVKKE